MLNTSISNIPLETCIYNASGCWSTTDNELEDLFNSGSGAVVSKSSTLLERNGNQKPRFYLNEYGSINSMGIPNLGYQFYSNYHYKYNIKPFFQSIAPFSIEELNEMLKYIELDTTTKCNRLIELNLSCPNIIGKSIVSYDFEEMDKFLDVVKMHEGLNIGLKLPPYYHNYEFDHIALITQKYNIKFITSINSLVNGLLIDAESENTLIHTKDGIGGIGGLYCKPITMSNVYRLYSRVKDTVDIVGCGGVTNGIDAFELILCGASAVQVGTQLMRESPTCFNRLNNELVEIMIKKGYTSINDFKGNLKILKQQNEDNYDDELY